MKRIIYTTALLYTILFVGCSNVSEEDLLEPIITGEKVVYADIQPIIQNNCTSCHSNPPQFGAPIALVTYDNVKSAVENSNLINRISLQSGESGAMPFGGPRLPQDLIDLMIQWEADGLLEDEE
ncbi:hypothetical protein [uncultured Lacinutrix sp.]|uniref:hypothetical protein n=1 Tax=uncultured Lacinutrix sp. TaxID=574032 RepID=UPI002630B54F|nr:hypothetical protein [uncultured Lacinutrix sp.]